MIAERPIRMGLLAFSFLRGILFQETLGHGLAVRNCPTVPIGGGLRVLEVGQHQPNGAKGALDVA
jgi:hypothetical protein